MTDLEKRVAALEAAVAELKKKVNGSKKPWWEQIAGAFANDPDFEEAMRLGRKWRVSFRPKSIKRRKKVTNVRARHGSR